MPTPTPFTLDSFFIFFLPSFSPSLPSSLLSFWNYFQNLLHLTEYPTNWPDWWLMVIKTSAHYPAPTTLLLPFLWYKLVKLRLWEIWRWAISNFVFSLFPSEANRKGITKATWQTPTSTFSCASEFRSGKGSAYRRQVRMALWQIWKLEYNKCAFLCIEYGLEPNEMLAKAQF